MRAHFLLTVAVLFFGISQSTVRSQPESILSLDPPPQGKLPFHKGDQLEIQGVANSAFTGVTRITVLDPTNWPWVLVKLEQGQIWLNFNNVITARAAPP